MKFLYAPNKDSTDDNESALFFQSIFDDTMDNNYEHVITSGDYNVALNHELDTSGYLHVNNQSQDSISKVG